MEFSVKDIDFHYGKYPDEEFMDLDKHPILPKSKRPQRRGAGILRTILIKMHGSSCFYCNRDLSKSIIICEHKIPLSRGGEEEIENFAISCDSCNSKKGMLTPDEFREKMARGSQ